MKRVWIPSSVLLAVFILTLCHSVYLTRFTSELSELLNQATVCAEAGDWPSAGEYHQQAHEKWEAKETYLHLLLHHDDTDAIYASFHEVEAFLRCQEAGEYSAANAQLVIQLELLAEAEGFSLKNIL